MLFNLFLIGMRIMNIWDMTCACKIKCLCCLSFETGNIWAMLMSIVNDVLDIWLKNFIKPNKLSPYIYYILLALCCYIMIIKLFTSTVHVSPFFASYAERMTNRVHERRLCSPLPPTHTVTRPLWESLRERFTKLQLLR